MAIFQSLAAFGVRQLVDGALSTVGLSAGGEAVIGLLAARFTDHSRKLMVALEIANERAWKAFEIALAGDSFWDRCKVVLSSGDDKAFREQVRAFLDANPLSPDSSGVCSVCLQELRTARKNNLLAGGSFDPKALAQQAGAFAGFADPQAVLAAEWQAVHQMADELRQAGYANLARLLSSRPAQGMPLLVVAVRYFFRRQVETDQELFHGLAFAHLERLGQNQDAGFAALDAALTQQGQRLEAMLAEIQAVVVETHGAVLDLQDQIEGQSEQVRQIGRDVQKLLEQHQLQRRELRPGDSLSIRNDNERQLVKQLVARYRALPEGDRKEVPSLLNAIGKLEVVAGDFDAAQKDFQAVALLEQSNKGQAEAHYNAYLASLEKRDWQGAIQELVKAIKLDAKRFAPFPVGKYHPQRILGAGGFGVAFLCKHKYMDAQVVVKTLALEELGRDADKVFTEAQVLRQLEHPAIIRISECGYVDPAKKSRPFILMDYFQGATLEEYVKKNGPLPADDLIAVSRQVAEGLHAAHTKGILHRDVKPANLLIHREEKAWKVKVIDFGLALRQKVVQKSANASTARQSKTLIGESIAGTVDYAAPEQMGKREGVAPGPYSDVYGWAKTCCYALFQTTQPLFSHWQSLPSPLVQLLEKCLNEDHTKRPQGFADLLAALDNMKSIPAAAIAPTRPAAATFAFEEAVEKAPKRSAAKTKRSASKLPLWIGGGVALAAMIAVILLMFVLRVKTTAGTLVVEVDQPGAEVFVDGKQVTIARPDDKEPIQVEVQGGTRQLKVVKGGFETVTKEFTVKSAAKETIRVRLERVEVAAAESNPPPEKPTVVHDLVPGKGNPVVVVKSTLGEFKVELFPDKAPKTVANFLGYVDDGFYNGTVIHRVTPGREIQAGLFWQGMKQKNATRPGVPSESDNGMSNVSGTIAMLNNASELTHTHFRINLADNSSWAEYLRVDNKLEFCVFGRIIAGQDVLKRIESVKTAGPRPIDEIQIISMRRQEDAPKEEKWVEYKRLVQVKAIRSMVVTRDGAKLVTGADDGFRVWSLVDDRVQMIFPDDRANWAICLGAEEKFLFVGSLAPVIRGLRMDTAQVSIKIDCQCPKPGAYVRYLALSSDDDTLMVSVQREKDACCLCLISVKKQSLIRTIEMSDAVFSIAASPIQRLAVTGSGFNFKEPPKDFDLKLWRLEDGKLIQRFIGHTASVWAVAFSPDGKYIVSAGEDKTIRLWKVDTGQLARQWNVDTERVFNLAFAPDGKQFASVDIHGIIRVFGTNGNAPVEIQGQGGTLFAVKFLPDGKGIVAAGGDGTIRFWREAK